MSVLGVELVDGPVTLGLVSITFGVAFVVTSVFAFMISRFQFKADALKVEHDLKDWIRKVESDVSRVQTTLERMSENVSYIRGRLEPTKPDPRRI